ncbi:hypothetical protein PsorP6_005434 [Peronosclerospora sorghi]|uniref:Uncharacterized protein n=1 Tax=Peronosclerospora sorghi TaxID=230839 RepID=A0ACC0W2Z8_9STRA|nr:hypothetical protein PsorP6_005434 [Peronosclerospora sorghi]
MPPYFQQHTIEMLLFIYGESRDFDALRGLFEKQVMARDELAGAVTSLKLFEILRTHGFVQPNGYTYLLTLQSCLRLERLEPAHARPVQSTGARVSKGGGNGAREQVTVAVNQVQGKTPKGIRQINRKESADHALDDERIFSPEELARIALFGHRYGLPMTLELADKLLQLHPHLSKRRRMSWLLVGCRGGTCSTRSRPRKRIVKTRVAPNVQKEVARVLPFQSDSSRRPRSKGFHAALRAATDARWGAILEPIASETE